MKVGFATSALLAANPEYCVLVALSPVLVPLVLLNTVKSASVTYLLFVTSDTSFVSKVTVPVLPATLNTWSV